MRRLTAFAILTIAVASVHLLDAGSQPIRTKKGMVISASEIASQIGAGVLRDGGNAIDAAVATAFALAVTHPMAGNIGGGGFLVFRSATGDAITRPGFRESAPTGSSPTMFLKSGKTIRKSTTEVTCRSAYPGPWPVSTSPGGIMASSPGSGLSIRRPGSHVRGSWSQLIWLGRCGAHSSR